MPWLAGQYFDNIYDYIQAKKDFDLKNGETDVKTMKNKFYVSASKIQDGNNHTGWRRATLEDAVKHAQELMESDGSKEKYIVKIVAVVKRQKPPITVEKVR